MKICLLGSSGFIGKNLYKNLSKKFSVSRINLRKIPFYNDEKLNKYLNKFNNSDVIINSAASLRPKNYRDFFINKDFPGILYNHINKNKLNIKFIHISTVNVLIKSRQDPYSKSKREAEKKLKNTKTIIIRLPLILERTKNNYKNSGVLSIFFKYLNINFLPFYPMVYPGHIYAPIELKNLVKFIYKLVSSKNENKNKIFNLAGRTKKSFWDLFKEIAFYKKKRILKLRFSRKNYLIKNYLEKYLKKKNGLLQQLIVIDNTKYGKKTIV